MTAPPLPKHPCKFSEPILDLLAKLVRNEQRRHGRPVLVLDPFAGVGRIHRLAVPGKIQTLGLEIEAEWAACHERTIHTDALTWMAGHAADRKGLRVNIAATSPDYGNRFSDSHEARDGSTRRSYRHDLGRPLSPGSSSGLSWGPRYWRARAASYRLIFDVLEPGGLFLLNVSDFVRGKAMVHATEWHLGAAMGAGFDTDSPRRWQFEVETRRQRYGQNHGHDSEEPTRADVEVVYRLRKPGGA